MKRFVISFGWLMAVTFVAVAATATSNEFRLDFYGLGPWERRVARSTETIAYSTAWATNAPAGAKAVVKVYPCLKEKPTYIAIDLSGGTNATHYPISFFNEIPGGSWSDEYKTSKLVLRHIPAGSFIMGGRNTDYPGAVNTNLHMVTLTRDFYMGVFEVTQRQWELVMGNRPSAFSNETCYATRPVESVSFDEIRGWQDGRLWPRSSFAPDTSFVGMMRNKTLLAGLGLPTEAQWEYACRAGTTTALNNGKNLQSLENESVELNEVSRNCYNAGWLKNHADDQWRLECLGASDEICTARVGCYLPNRYGLYDMHGNVWEWYISRHPHSVLESVDPVGPDEGFNNFGGGSFQQNELVTYARKYNTLFPPTIESQAMVRHQNVGFRLCLQGGEVPDLAAATLLVDAASTGTMTWTPTKAGTFYLTHATMNDATVRQLQSAWFEVGGPKLSLSANGELEPGAGVAVAGNEPGWTVYYTVDGTEPTTNATVYTGAITLDETTTIRVVAYNAQGVRSEEVSATFTLHDALGVASAVAMPRYPWNGKVDVDVELKGDPEAMYLVELEAKDLAGGTNLPVRTVACGRANTPGSPSSAGDRIAAGDCAAGVRARPGAYRFTWDAAADVEGNFDFNRVAVTVKATGSHLLAYPMTLELTVAGYTGTEVLTNVPTLVRLSTAIAGFSYADFATTNGADLAFFDADEHLLPYEVDEWNTNGESLVWVKLPVFAKGTRFTAAWGNSELCTLNSQLAPHEVWRDYAGVWHMNEPSGTAFDSTEHHLDGIPSCGTNELADVSQMVAYEKGACGRARVNASQGVWGGNYMLVPAYDGLGLADFFVVSGWFRMDGLTRYPKMIFRGNVWTDGGWGAEFYENTKDCVQCCGGLNTVYLEKCVLPQPVSNWALFTFVYSGNNLALYYNGNCITNNVEIVPATDNGLPLAIGSTASARSNSFVGQYDEIRLRSGTLSADRIKADYDMIVNRNFLGYGAVQTHAGRTAAGK